MLDAQERSQLIVALEAWARSVPDKSLVGFLDGDKLFSPKEIVREVREETPDGQAVLEILEHGVRREGVSSVVARLEVFSPGIWWCILFQRVEGAMGQILHRSATTTEAIRRAIQHSQLAGLVWAA